MDKFLSYACRRPCAPAVTPEEFEAYERSGGRIVWILVAGPSSDDTKEIAIAALRAQHGTRFASSPRLASSSEEDDSAKHRHRQQRRSPEALNLAQNYTRAAEDECPHMLVFTAIPDEKESLALWETYARRASGCVIVADAAHNDWLERSLIWADTIKHISPSLSTILLLDLLDFSDVGDDESSFDEVEDEFEVGAQLNKPRLKMFAKNCTLQPFVGAFFWNRRALPTLDHTAADAITALVRAIDTNFQVQYRLDYPSHSSGSVQRRSCDVLGCFRAKAPS